jgi:hypothetical protein
MLLTAAYRSTGFYPAPGYCIHTRHPLPFKDASLSIPAAAMGRKPYGSKHRVSAPYIIGYNKGFIALSVSKPFKCAPGRIGNGIYPFSRFLLSVFRSDMTSQNLKAIAGSVVVPDFDMTQALTLFPSITSISSLKYVPLIFVSTEIYLRGRFAYPLAAGCEGMPQKLNGSPCSSIEPPMPITSNTSENPLSCRQLL